MSFYAGFWVVGYVCVFPLFVFWKLLSYNRKLRERTKDVSELRYVSASTCSSASDPCSF